MEYLLVKWVHIVSSTILFGTGIGSAFYMFMANMRRDVAAIAFAGRHVVIADWVFTTPGVIVQFFSGLWLLHLTGYSLADRWVLWGIILYFFAGICWLPVVWMQIKMRDMAQKALLNAAPLPSYYWTLSKWWNLLGALAFPAVMVIFYLMVVKP